jgi:hypothetical protein
VAPGGRVGAPKATRIETLRHDEAIPVVGGPEMTLSEANLLAVRDYRNSESTITIRGSKNKRDGCKPSL